MLANLNPNLIQITQHLDQINFSTQKKTKRIYDDVNFFKAGYKSEPASIPKFIDEGIISLAEDALELPPTSPLLSREAVIACT